MTPLLLQVAQVQGWQALYPLLILLGCFLVAELADWLYHKGKGQQ